MNVAFGLPAILPGPVRTAIARQVGGQVAGGARIQVTRQVAGAIAKSGLAEGAKSGLAITPVSDAAAFEPGTQDEPSAPQAKAANGAIAELGTTCPPGVKSVGAAKALVRRNVPLIEPDGS